MLAAALLSHEAGKGMSACRWRVLRLSRSLTLLRYWRNCLNVPGNRMTGRQRCWHRLPLARGDAATPLILTDERLYLNRMWCNERQVAAFFAQENTPLAVDETRLTQALASLFPASDDVNWQKVAAAVALTRRISVISGGPNRQNHHRG